MTENNTKLTKTHLIIGAIVLIIILFFVFSNKPTTEQGQSLLESKNITTQQKTQISDINELATLLYGEKKNGEETSPRIMIESVLERMDDLRYIKDIKYYSNNKKIIFDLNEKFLNDEHVAGIISALAGGVLGDYTKTRENSLTLFLDNNPETGDVYGWNFYRIYLKATQPKDYCYGINYDEDCGVGKNSGLPVYRTHPIIEETSQDLNNLEIIQIVVDDKLIATFVNGSVFDELSRLNLIGEAQENGQITETPKLQL